MTLLPYNTETPIESFYFCHIHKTAGISFQTMLKDKFNSEYLFDIVDVFVDQERFKALSRKVVYGHSLFCLNEFLNIPRTFFILREPISRIISYWKHITRENQDIPLNPLFKLNWGEIISNPLFISLCCNTQTKILVSVCDFDSLAKKVQSVPYKERAQIWVEEYKKLIHSVLLRPCTVSTFTLAKAAVNTSDFAIFENIGNIGSPFLQYSFPWKNKAPKDQTCQLDNPEAKKWLRDLNGFDLALYEYALERKMRNA